MTVDDDEILIGEGVAIDTAAAPVTLRMLSGGLDALVYGLFTFSLMGAVLNTIGGALNSAAQGAVVIGLLVICLVLIPALVETLSRGSSVGRIAVGLRIVRDDGGPASFRHSFIRAFTAIAEVYMTLGVIAITTSTLSARGKRLGDMLAGTYSMRVRGAPKPLPPIQMPAQLAPWANAADIRRLPDGLALTCRTFIARAPGLRPDARARLGNELFASLREYVSPAPPADAHPEYVIAAVLAERGAREFVIEQRRQGRIAREDQRVSTLPYGLPDA
ncbi:RDD family protein [Demequina flava]|uniref:RDD family protein n=1 Tax=Demequina flava TaxID=1095025 RepID=UPI0007817116|nr:RDD family protein [Demequina flava]